MQTSIYKELYKDKYRIFQLPVPFLTECQKSVMTGLV